jgi:hypothetical protein
MHQQLAPKNLSLPTRLSQLENSDGQAVYSMGVSRFTRGANETIESFAQKPKHQQLAPEEILFRLSQFLVPKKHRLRLMMGPMECTRLVPGDGARLWLFLLLRPLHAASRSFSQSRNYIPNPKRPPQRFGVVVVQTFCLALLLFVMRPLPSRKERATVSINQNSPLIEIEIYVECLHILPEDLLHEYPVEQLLEEEGLKR